MFDMQGTGIIITTSVFSVTDFIFSHVITHNWMEDSQNMFIKDEYWEASVSFSLERKKKEVKIEYLPRSNAEIMLHTKVQATALLNQLLMPPC